MDWFYQLRTGLTRNSDGTFSSTKFWQAVVYTICSTIMIILVVRDKMEIEYFLVYLAIATGARSLQNYLVNKSSAGRVEAVAQGADPQDVKSVSPPTN